MSERIWGVDDAWDGPKLESAEVVRRGEKIVRVKERVMAFGCLVNVPVRLAHATPEAAIAAFAAKTRDAAANLREQAQRLEDKAARALTLSRLEPQP